MEYRVTGSGVAVRGLEDFSLNDTLTCGQCFRWRNIGKGTFQGVAFGRPLTISQDSTGSIIFHGISEEEFLSMWREYFDLDFDYGAAKRKISEHSSVLKDACTFAPGIRILRQEPFEALCSFILSQNNNIPRIEGIVRRLCECFGEEIGEGQWSFPNVERLSLLSEDDLAPIRCGFRAKYLLDAARKVARGEIDLAEIDKLPLDEARNALMQIHGVGPKVADCTLLYGLHRLDAFPQDVWIKRAVEVFFPEGFPSVLEPIAGLAQQYLFHYCRKNPDVLVLPEE